VRTPLVLAAGLLLIVIAIGITMLHSPYRLLASNNVENKAGIGSAEGVSQACQSYETLPRDTSAITLFLEAIYGPKVILTAFAGRRVITRGSIDPGWTGASVTVPIKPIRQTTSGVKLCIALGPGREVVSPLGNAAPPKLAMVSEGHSLLGRMRVEFLRQGNRSWASLTLPTARRLGLGRALTGTWVALLLAALMLTAAGAASWLVLRELR
jgi:hypothetical protein